MRLDDIIPSHPHQQGSYFDYHTELVFFFNLQIFDMTFDFGHINYQNTFILHLCSSNENLEIVEKERQSTNPNDTNKYKAGCFFSTLQALVTDIEQRRSCSGTPNCSMIP